MSRRFLKWIHLRYSNVINSIAFMPAVIALIFLLLSWLMIKVDFSTSGKQVKAKLSWLSLKDATTARTIISTVVGGIISLTVFSFSLVMLILNQAASQMSNRVLDKLIGNRFQQSVLGCYIGTIVYALFLLSTIRDIDTGVHVPALSTYLLIAFTIFDIFLFIYFLHYITQSVKYETIIHRVSEQTLKAMKQHCVRTSLLYPPHPVPEGHIMAAPAIGVFQGFDEKALLKAAREENGVISFLHPAGTFVLCGTPLAVLSNGGTFSKAHIESIQHAITIQRGEDIANNYFYGFRQLMEVAVKALSPGINDPGTAVLCLQALASLLTYRLQHFPAHFVEDEAGSIRIILKERTVEEIATECLLPIWDYGEKDRTVQQAFLQVLVQLQAFGKEPVLERLRQMVMNAAQEK
jgi:uncharacterized membrane protein